MTRDENTQYILSLSYGKDSLACLEAIKLLGWPLDRIVHAEVWATDTIPADLPPMVDFKAKADAIIKERYGLEVEHVCAMRDGEKLTYEKVFYHVPQRKEGSKYPSGSIQGFPTLHIPWCNSNLKRDVLNKKSFYTQDPSVKIIQYLGIAVDEPERIAKHNKPGFLMPLVEIGWTEAQCRQWCEEYSLLSPIYSSVTRGGAGSVIIKKMKV